MVLNEVSSPKINQKAVAAMKKVIASHQYKPHKNDHPDDIADMKAMYADDAKILTKVLDLYVAGKWKAAYKVAANMDTSSRELIHIDIFNDIAEA